MKKAPWSLGAAASLSLVALALATSPRGDAGEPPSPAKGAAAAAAPAKPAVPTAAASFDRLTALAGEWIDVDGTMGMKDKVAVTYHVTGAGSAVVETLFVGMPHEMVTVYHRDGNDLVLTHYCAAGNQPRMRARKVDGDVIAFDYDGGTNLDPAKDGHMHSGRIELVSADEIRAVWNGWAGGKPEQHVAKFHLKRKRA